MERGHATVVPPQLQLVCGSLYDRVCADGRQLITEADYEALGGAQGGAAELSG